MPTASPATPSSDISPTTTATTTASFTTCRTGTYTTLDDPSASQTFFDNYSTGGTFASGISGNIIVGDYFDAQGIDHGFMYNDRTGVFTTLDDPNAIQARDYGTYAVGVSGHIIIGNYLDSGGVEGFYYNILTGVYTNLFDPKATYTYVTGYFVSVQGTRADGISGNSIVGNYIDALGVSHGYIYNLLTGVYTTLDEPKATTAGYVPGTLINAISGSTIVGPYTGRGQQYYNFIYNGRTFANINDDPNSSPQNTDVNGICGNTLVGDFLVGNNVANVWDTYGYVAVPTTRASHSSISGVVFNDRNGNGGQDFHDRGLAGVTVTLQELKDGNPDGPARTATTDASGHYSFNHLQPGTYQVTQTPGPHQVLTFPFKGEGPCIIAAAGPRIQPAIISAIM